MTEIERRFLLGVDLAKAQDYTSFAAVEMTRKDGAGYYYISGFDRIRGVEYPKIEKRILEIYNQLEDDEPDVLDGPHLCMDSSGLGAPIRDYLKQHHVFTRKKEIYPVIFTSSQDKARKDPETGTCNISKTLMVTKFISLQQHRQLSYPPDLPYLDQLLNEIESFRQEMTKAGNITYNAEPGAHDDLICSAMIPLIIGEWIFMERPRQLSIPLPKKSIHGRGLRPSMISTMGWDRPTNSWADMGLRNPY